MNIPGDRGFIHFNKDFVPIEFSPQLDIFVDQFTAISLKEKLAHLPLCNPEWFDFFDIRWLALKFVDESIWLFKFHDNHSKIEPTSIIQNIIKHVPCYVFWKNSDLVYLGCNQLFAEAAGVSSPNDIIGKTDFDLPWATTEAELFRQDDKYILQGHEKLNYEETQLQAGGKFTYVLASKAPLRDEQGNIKGIVGVYSDITSLKLSLQEAQKARHEAEKANKAKTEFVAIVSHELRTPLNGILGLSESLLNRKDIPSDVLDELSLINVSGKHLAKIVCDLLEYSALQSKNNTPAAEIFSLSELINETKVYFKNEASSKNIKFNTKLAVKNDIIISDPKKIRQIIINLVGNSLKFTMQGFVNLEINDSVIKPNEIDIVVRDSGIGIERKQLKEIFEKFVQVGDPYNRKQGGLGLGLAITKEIVDIMKGQILVDSIPKQGTIFRVSLPVIFTTNRTKRESENQPVQVQELPKFNCILIVEDNKINQKVAEKFIQPYANRIDMCDDGISAIDKAKLHIYDLIFLDISLPDIKGTEVAKRIRQLEQYRNTPIIALTAHASEEEKESFFRAGIDDAIFKPLAKSELANLFAKWR